MNHSGVCIFFGNTQENFRSNLALVVVLVLESKGLQCLSGGNKLLHVRSFIILRSGEGLTTFNKNNRVTSVVKKKKPSAVSIFSEYATKTFSQISTSYYSSSSSNVKVSNICFNRTKKGKWRTWSVFTLYRPRWCIIQPTSSSKLPIHSTMSVKRRRLWTSCRMHLYSPNR